VYNGNKNGYWDKLEIKERQKNQWNNVYVEDQKHIRTVIIHIKQS
jgi:hypothetical protein